MQAPGTVPNAVLDILKDGREHGLEELREALPHVKREQISRALTTLKNRDLMKRQMVTGVYQLSSYGHRLAQNGYRVNSGAARPIDKVRRHADSFRARAWRAIRVRRVFSLGDIISDAKDGEADPYNNLRRYVRQLTVAGYIVEMPVRTPGVAASSNGFKRYRLIRDAGPLAPTYSPKRGVVVDLNIESEAPCR